MERVMSVEEKIRRAEERYEQKRQGEIRPVAKVTVSDKKDIKLLKKMIIQIMICVAIYLVINAIYSNQYVFSEDFINKANEILSYDTNFGELYKNAKSMFQKFINTDETKNDENINIEENTGTDEETNTEETTNAEENTNLEETTTNETASPEESIGGAEEMTQEEQDIINIKNTATFIKPIDGIISSRFGQRDSATGSVPKNHTGTDIAANLGTKIKSATDGEVVLCSEEGDYRKTLKNSNRRSKYNICTLQCFICKTRR